MFLIKLFFKILTNNLEIKFISRNVFLRPHECPTHLSPPPPQKKKRKTRHWFLCYEQICKIATIRLKMEE